MKNVLKTLIVSSVTLGYAVSSLTQAHAIGTEVVKDDSRTYLALSSSERGYKRQSAHFAEDIKSLEYFRAQQICEARGFLGLADFPQTQELLSSEKVDVLIAEQGIFKETSLRCKKPWVFKKWKSKTRKTSRGIATAGGIMGLTMAPLLPLVPLIAAPAAVPFFENEIPYEDAWLRIRNNKPVGRYREIIGKKVPHLIFTSVVCTQYPDDLMDLGEDRAWLSWEKTAKNQSKLKEKWLTFLGMNSQFVIKKATFPAAEL